jgi:hypothetical protein
MEPARSAEQRKQDTLNRLASDVDAWIATADSAGNAYLVPLSFLWDGTGVIVSTPSSSVTGRNLSRSAGVRVGVGLVRDVITIDGKAERVQDEPTKAAFAARHGWDPRDEAEDYAFFRIVPDRLQAWREVNELSGRTLMRDGSWLV